MPLAYLFNHCSCGIRCSLWLCIHIVVVVVVVVLAVVIVVTVAALHLSPNNVLQNLNSAF